MSGVAPAGAPRVGALTRMLTACSYGTGNTQMGFSAWHLETELRCRRRSSMLCLADGMSAEDHG